MIYVAIAALALASGLLVAFHVSVWLELRGPRDAEQARKGRA